MRHPLSTKTSKASPNYQVRGLPSRTMHRTPRVHNQWLYSMPTRRQAKELHEQQVQKEALCEKYGIPYSKSWALCGGLKALAHAKYGPCKCESDNPPDICRRCCAGCQASKKNKASLKDPPKPATQAVDSFHALPKVVNKKMEALV